MTTPRFDPAPEVDYGSCITCGVPLPTQENAHEHMSTTVDAGGSSHRIALQNPPRERRIRSHVSTIISTAVEDALTEVARLVNNNEITRAEADRALCNHPDFGDVWNEAAGELLEGDLALQALDLDLDQSEEAD